jgi:hypothetical protein
MLSETSFATHQRLDAFQHKVEVLGQTVELIASTGDWQSATEIAVHDCARGLGHGVDPA